MDPNIAVTFFSTMAQVSGTILAVYLAIVIFFLQDKDLAEKVLITPAKRPFQYSFAFFCLGNSGLILGCFHELLKLNMQSQFDNLTAYGYTGTFALLLIVLFYNFIILMQAKEKLLIKEKKE